MADCIQRTPAQGISQSVEPSPVDSLMSSFDDHPSQSYEGTVNPSNINNGEDFQLFDDNEHDNVKTEDDNTPPASSVPPENSEENKPKKRKSWGQQLPQPKTCLPPRYV